MESEEIIDRITQLAVQLALAATQPVAERAAIVNRAVDGLDSVERDQVLVGSVVKMTQIIEAGLLQNDPAQVAAFHEYLLREGGMLPVLSDEERAGTPTSQIPDDLSELLDSAYRDCPRCGTRMDDVGDEAHAWLRCPWCRYQEV